MSTMVHATTGRREFLRLAAITNAGLALAKRLHAAPQKSILVFTKSSDFEHDMVKRAEGKPSMVDDAVTALGDKHSFHVSVTKDGRIFGDTQFHKYAAVVFFTTDDLTTLSTDGKPPMSHEGKEKLLDAIHKGMGFVSIHAASDTFHPQPDPKDLSSRYIA